MAEARGILNGLVTDRLRQMPRPTRAARAIAIVLACCLVGACSSSSKHASSSASTTTVSAATPTTSVLLTPAGGTYGVGMKTITLVDHSRGTDADTKNGVAAKDDRTLPTVILYPTTNRDDDATSDKHPVAKGRFPLVVFAHGITASGPAYVPIAKRIAAKGFIVALPTFPLTSGPKGWSNFNQLVNQPYDVTFVIGQVLKRASGNDPVLAGHVDADEVAVAGHSLGAITALYSFNSCCRDRRVKAVVAISGLLFPAKDKTDNFDNPPSDLPLLLLHGDKDGTVPYGAGSQHIFASFTKVPRAFVTFPGVGHINILSKPSLNTSIVAFLDLELRHDSTEWDTLKNKIAKNGDARIETAGGLATPK